MTRKIVALTALTLAFGLIGCVETDPQGAPDPDDGAFALTNTTNYAPEGLLRGQGLKVYAEFSSEDLRPNTVYIVEVFNDDRGESLIQSDLPQPVVLRTTDSRSITPYAVMFDVGQYEEVSEGEHIRVSLTDPQGERLEQIIDLSILRLPGWDVTEVEAPEVFACDASGDPANAFAVGGSQVGETAGPVYITGNNFSPGSTVHAYIVEAEDDWMDRLIPQEGEAGHVLGPIAIDISSDGSLPLTALPFADTTSTDYNVLRGLVGVYDLLVDTDLDGDMDWEFGVKDGGDGADEQVGFTIQYSQAWLAARGERHILVNIAYDSSSRSGGTWSNTYRSTDRVFSYMNPPVMHQYHFAVTKWVVRHQDFDEFWNNPEMETGPNGCVPFQSHAVNGMGIPVQRGCTNTGPVDFGPLAISLDPGENAYDVVFDRNGDGCYEAGEDILDVVGGATVTGELVTFEQFQALDRADRVGFHVIE